MTVHACKGNSLSVEQVLDLFPELRADHVRTILDRASRHRLGEQALRPDPLADLVARAQDNAGLSEEDAMKLAIEGTREVRAELPRASDKSHSRPLAPIELTGSRRSKHR